MNMPLKTDIPSLVSAYTKVRMEALRATLKPHDHESMALDKAEWLDETEKEQVLRHIFDASRTFGLLIAETEGHSWNMEKIMQFIRQSHIACVNRPWQLESQRSCWMLERSGCSNKPSRFRCAYWREAIDGLVMGVGDRARYARYCSLGFGEQECVDILYDCEHTDKQWGTIPEPIWQSVQGTVDLFQERGIALNFYGYSEGTLFYDLKGSVHGLRYHFLTETLQRKISQVLPEVSLVDITPRAVFEA